VKILVTVKRVEDPEIRIKIKDDGGGLVTDSLKYVANPYDIIAVEEALRVKATVDSEIVVLSIGVEDAAHQIRTALAMGADRAIHIVTEESLDPFTVAQAMTKIVADESPDLIIMGKQAVDDDMGQTGSLLAELLGWPQASYASKEANLESADEKAKKAAFSIDGNTVTVCREVDGGLETLKLTLPALITTELRLNIPRYASLPGIMKAKKKEIKKIPWSELAPDLKPIVNILKLTPPKTRAAGVVVESVSELMDKLRNEAKAL
jgi:electron transfer flavoprotein beta subunit